MPKRPRARGRNAERERSAAPEDPRPAARAAGAAASSGWGRPLFAAVIAVALVCAVYPRHSWKTYRNGNEQARLYLVKAMVEEGVLNIDSGIKTYGDLQDKATKDGHFYCDKPVGLSVLAVPVYFVLYHAGRIVGYGWGRQARGYGA